MKIGCFTHIPYIPLQRNEMNFSYCIDRAVKLVCDITPIETLR